MQYKTTYFNLSINSESLIPHIIYRDRLEKDKIILDINNLEKIILTQIGSKFEDKLITEYSIKELIEIQKEVPQYKNLQELIQKKQTLEGIPNQRYTDEDNTLFQNHINEVAKDGWVLVSFQPILKGIYGSVLDGGFGTSITEGFVIVWEKP